MAAEKHRPRDQWCQCDDCTLDRAKSHRDANIAVGRPNDGCACGACKRAAEIAVRRVTEGCARITELENHLAAFRAVRRMP